MSKEQYYTPTIEEFHVGFEYRECDIETAQYVDCIFKDGQSAEVLLDGDYGEVDVKYLDKEDIEELGWEDLGSLWFKHKNGYKLRKWKEQSLDIWEESLVDTDDDGLIFRGNIKNKSELEKLMKQLSIIK